MTKSSSSSQSKKFVLENCTLAYKITTMIGKQSLKNICKTLEIDKQRLNYWVGKLVKSGIIERCGWGSYRLVETSKEILGELKLESRREQIRLENMRFDISIFEGFDHLVSVLKWDKIQPLNKIKIYHGKFRGYTIRLFSGKSPSMEVTCRQWFGYEPYAMMYDVRKDIEWLVHDMEKKYGLKLGRLRQSMKPEFAIPSPLAEGVLTHMGASQVRTPEATFNRSKGRNADFEPKTLQLAHQVVQMPLTIEAIFEQNEIILEKLAEMEKHLPEKKIRRCKEF